MWFRPETVTEVKWAGDPNKAIIKDEKGLSPRKSFELWKEEIKLQSKDWTEPELSAASTFAYNLERQVHLLFLNEEQNKFRALNEVLQETNAELENINWISTHDLNEPLRKIRLFGSRLLDTYGAELNGPVIDSIRRMNNSAGRMQALISDILAYSKLRKNQDMLVDADLNQIVRDVHRQMEEDNLEGVSQLTLTAGQLPVIRGISFLLNQLFVNLFRNSLKFARTGVPPEIRVTATETEIEARGNMPAGVYHQITVSDNGIGFDNEFRESIFNLFSRLHTQTEYAGTGIGLALCKKIMQIHRGTIAAQGTPDAGADFFLYFPK
jgi:light-regulated signal transduction histidine kinase (bacteriophytochrome)